VAKFNQDLVIVVVWELSGWLGDPIILVAGTSSSSSRVNIRLGTGRITPITSKNQDDSTNRR
jgi:hypothetical protein